MLINSLAYIHNRLAVKPHLAVLLGLQATISLVPALVVETIDVHLSAAE